LQKLISRLLAILTGLRPGQQIAPVTDIAILTPLFHESRRTGNDESSRTETPRSCYRHRAVLPVLHTLSLRSRFNPNLAPRSAPLRFFDESRETRGEILYATVNGRYVKLLSLSLSLFLSRDTSKTTTEGKAEDADGANNAKKTLSELGTASCTRVAFGVHAELRGGFHFISAPPSDHPFVERRGLSASSRATACLCCRMYTIHKGLDS